VCKVGGNNPKYQSEHSPGKIYLGNRSNRCNHTPPLTFQSLKSFYSKLVFP
jgi:hypothetical protein